MTLSETVKLKQIEPSIFQLKQVCRNTRPAFLCLDVKCPQWEEAWRHDCNEWHKLCQKSYVALTGGNKEVIGTAVPRLHTKKEPGNFVSRPSNLADFIVLSSGLPSATSDNICHAAHHARAVGSKPTLHCCPNRYHF